MIKAKIEAVLLDYMYPLLFVAKSAFPRTYLCIAIDDEQNNNPYLCIRITDLQSESLMNCEIDVKSLYVKPHGNIWYLGELIDETINITRYKDSVWDIPPKHMPSPGLFVRQNLPSQTTTSQINTRTIKIDGDWTPSDLQQVSRSYNQIYATAYLLENATSDTIQKRIIDHPYKDGFSSMHLHRELLSNIPGHFRPRIKEVKYASPGHITIRGQDTSLSHFIKVASIIKSSYAELIHKYTLAHTYLSEHKLLRLDVSDFDNSRAIQHGSELDRHFSALCQALQLESRITLKFQDANKLAKVKYLLIYYRRIDELRELVFSEKITIE